MNRFLVLLFVAIAAIVLVLVATNPALVDQVWLYVIGLFGLIGKVFQSFFDRLKKVFEDIAAKKQPGAEDAKGNPMVPKPALSPTADDFSGLTITVLRYMDDGETTLGMLYVEDQYFCLTLEDTFHEKKIASETRIPAGEYNIQFRKVEGEELTQKYREKFPDWFTYHLELQQVPDYSHVYIHSGKNHQWTEGSLIVTDSIMVQNDVQAFLEQSEETFKRLYLLISQSLNKNIKVRVIIKDEHWFNQLKAA